MARDAKSFKRKEPRFQQIPTVLILCEDLKSGKRYLEDAALHFRSNAKVEIAHCGVTHPLGIVEEAVERQKKFDKVYCAIDRDTHQSFDQALLLARRHDKIQVIASYPCFEVWLLLHFGYMRRPFMRSGNRSAADCVSVELKRKPGMNDYEKAANVKYFNQLLGEPFATARAQSPRVLSDAIANGELNPSTEIHLLIDEIENLSKPKLA
ncbi:RloB family protein [Pseudomonas monteilii]|uniref:RloB family protein n=1 Tax=Pseudomonas monteilii TaxID=76759 RepID=UPI001E3EFA70|nr:RloB family protein [Pseudomonas monteilii]MCE1005632.1 RloB family protein [Pseudomonas monteilii]